MSDKAFEGARAYFSEGRCSGHNQFNGRYCRDVAGPERWCIHCAGFMLVAALTAAHEREAALRKENARLSAVAAMSVALQADVARLTGELAEADKEILQLRLDVANQESALAAERQKVSELVGVWTKRRDAIKVRHKSGPLDYKDGLIDAHTDVIKDVADHLGLTTTESPQKRCPACGHKAHQVNECRVCNGCNGYGSATPPQGT